MKKKYLFETLDTTDPLHGLFMEALIDLKTTMNAHLKLNHHGLLNTSNKQGDFVITVLNKFFAETLCALVISYRIDEINHLKEHCFKAINQYIDENKPKIEVYQKLMK